MWFKMTHSYVHKTVVHQTIQQLQKCFFFQKMWKYMFTVPIVERNCDTCFNNVGSSPRGMSSLIFRVHFWCFQF